MPKIDHLRSAFAALQPEHLEVLGLQGGESATQVVDLGHRWLQGRDRGRLAAGHVGCQGFLAPSSLPMSVSSLLTAGTALSSLAWVICADWAVSAGICLSTFWPLSLIHI